MDVQPGLDRDGAVEESLALRDAAQIARRAAEDEQQAVEARARYKATGLPTIEPDTLVANQLGPDEAVIDVRRSAVVQLHHGGDDEQLFAGGLYLTNRRLVLLGQRPFFVDLAAIEEVELAGERLLVSLRDATGVTIEASRPRLLRVQIAAALAAVRA